MLSTLLQGAKYFFVAALLQRLASFAINQVIVRITDPAVLGFGHNDMELLLATLLFIVRETFRTTILRSPAAVWAQARGAAYQSLMNLAWISAGIGIGAAAAMAALAYFTPMFPAAAAYSGAIVATCGGVVLEFMAEPLFISAQNQLQFGLRAAIDVAASFSRSLSLLALLFFKDLGPLAFGLSQTLYGGVVLFGYAAAAARRRQWPQRCRRIPRPSKNSGDGSDGDGSAACCGWVLAPHLSDAKTFGVQSLLQFALSQGDRIIMAATSSMHDKGVYGVVSNYGSLAARMLFAPIEDASRSVFSKLAAKNAEQHNGEGGEDASEGSAEALAATLVKMYRLLCYVSLVFLCFGIPYSPTVIRVLLGAEWAATEVPSVLQVYCCYLPFLAVNGITEAFVHSVAPRSALKRFNALLILNFVAYMALSLAATRFLGTKGLVLAGIGNMCGRIPLGVHFIQSYFKERSHAFSLWQALPPFPVLSLFGIAAALSWLSHFTFAASAITSLVLPWKAFGFHLSLGGALAMAVAGLSAWKDPSLLALLRRRKAEKLE